jgi:hypothetical protein
MSYGWKDMHGIEKMRCDELSTIFNPSQMSDGWTWRSLPSVRQPVRQPVDKHCMHTYMHGR